MVSPLSSLIVPSPPGYSQFVRCKRSSFVFLSFFIQLRKSNAPLGLSLPFTHDYYPLSHSPYTIPRSHMFSVSLGPDPLYVGYVSNRSTTYFSSPLKGLMSDKSLRDCLSRFEAGYASRTPPLFWPLPLTLFPPFFLI